MGGNTTNVYLDNQSTTQVDERVLAAMLPFLTINFGNPSSNNQHGLKSRFAFNKAKEQVASLINSSPDEIYFTSGATEAINWALRGVAEKSPLGKNHIIISTIEHSSVLKTCEFLESYFHFQITRIKPQQNGIIDPIDIKSAINSTTLMVAVQHANNEIGTIQPIEELGKICTEAGVLFLVDAAQSVGKINCDVKKMNIDLLAVSGHKLYAPKGIGFLFVNDEIRGKINPLLYGGGQQSGLRPGTPNIPYIVALGEACNICIQSMMVDNHKILSLRNEFINIIESKVTNMIINGCLENRLPGNINFSVPGVVNDVLLRNLQGISISKGSACASSKIDQSYVLQSITNDESIINSAIRIGVGRFNTREEILLSATKIATAIEEIKRSNAQF